MASPDPTAITFTVYWGYAFWKAGNNSSKRPESCVEVVDARMMSLLAAVVDVESAVVVAPLVTVTASVVLGAAVVVVPPQAAIRTHNKTKNTAAKPPLTPKPIAIFVLLSIHHSLRRSVVRDALVTQPDPDGRGDTIRTHAHRC
jgi:hypothetical protein